MTARISSGCSLLSAAALSTSGFSSFSGKAGQLATASTGGRLTTWGLVQARRKRMRLGVARGHLLADGGALASVDFICLSTVLSWPGAWRRRFFGCRWAQKRRKARIPDIIVHIAFLTRLSARTDDKANKGA